MTEMNENRLVDANEVVRRLEAVKAWFDGEHSNEQDKLAQAVVKLCIDEVNKIKTADEE